MRKYLCFCTAGEERSHEKYPLPRGILGPPLPLPQHSGGPHGPIAVSSPAAVCTVPLPFGETGPRAPKSWHPLLRKGSTEALRVREKAEKPLNNCGGKKLVTSPAVPPRPPECEIRSRSRKQSLRLQGPRGHEGHRKQGAIFPNRRVESRREQRDGHVCNSQGVQRRRGLWGAGCQRAQGSPRQSRSQSGSSLNTGGTAQLSRLQIIFPGRWHPQL